MSAPAMPLSWRSGFSFVWARLQNKARYIIFRTLSACSKVWIPLISGAMVDIVATPDFPISHLCSWAALGLVVEIFNYATGTWLGYFWEKSVLFSTVDIRKTLWRKIQNISAQRWDSLPVGTWQVRLVRDAQTVLSSIRAVIDFSIETSVSFIFASFVILWNVPVLWFVLMLFGVAQFFTYKCYGGRFQKMAQRSRRLDYQAGKINYDLIGFVSLFKQFGATTRFFPVFDGILHRTTRRALASSRLGISYNLVLQCETWSVRIFVLIFCIWQYTRGAISIGDIVVFNMYVGQLIGVVMNISGVLPTIETGKESAHALSELLSWCDEGARENASALAVPSESENISAKKLTFCYENASAPIIRNFSEVIAPRSYVCFIGRNGSGKSTLLKLLTHVYQPTSGSVSSPNEFSIVPQKNSVFNDTLLENIRLRDEAFSAKCVEETLRLCGLERFLLKNPLYKKLRPEALSGGELQMLAIARALVRNPRVLLLDEPTNNLDIVASTKIMEILDHLRGKITIILVSHNLHVANNCDRLFFFRQSEILEIKGDSATREATAKRLLLSEN